MSGRNAEGRTCEICRRTLLAGETFAFFDDLVRRKHRRPVCVLCQRDVKIRGWTRTVELPPPIVFPTLTDDHPGTAGAPADPGDVPSEANAQPKR